MLQNPDAAYGPTGAAIECRNVVLRFSNARTGVPTPILDGIDLEVKPGEFLCIVGPSGCGKTTVLNLVAGLLKPNGGAVAVDGAPVRGVRRDVAYLTQKDTLLPWLTALRNVHLPIEAVGQSDPGFKQSRALLELVGLKGFEDHYPHQLSGGMRKRVQLARALAQQPRVLLMDEPFGALDYQTKMLMHRRFLDIWERDRKTVLFVTHDLSEAIALGDRILVTSNRPAKVLQIFDVDIPRPRSVENLVDDAAYRALYHSVWNLLKAEFDQQS